MRTEEARPVRLVDYRPPDWLVDAVELDVSLDPTATRVRATLALRPNPTSAAPSALVLDGEQLKLTSLKLDGVTLPDGQYVATGDRLTIAQPPQRSFRLEIETVVDPSANTELLGLYRSSGNYCTQCEAEGFRRITYFPDRPDVMAVYTTRIEADKADAPVLLANGNLVSSGDVPGTSRHFAVWHDPFPKPSYLFALVGGKLACVEDTFRTMSGREVALKIYVEPGKEARCAHAMDSLKRSMRWDEQAFGREYDLDIFMIVAVSDFNMGAMENKGLNVFNDKYVLASPETATDADYEKIEAIIAHEYFHNWTGNRITCRDWFQLCLKEGLTVFRDQEFSAERALAPRSSASATCAACAHISSSRMRGRSPIRCALRSITRSTISTRQPSTRRAPRSCGCCGRCSARTSSARAWTCTSPATTARRRPSSSSCSASRTSPAGTSPSSCCGTRKPARRKSSHPAALTRARKPTAWRSSRRCRRHPGSRTRSRWSFRLRSVSSAVTDATCRSSLPADRALSPECSA